MPQQYVIVDEAQNLTPHEVKTIITRCGEGTKIVLTGDPFQIDNPYVDSSTNGLSVAAEKLRGDPIVGHIVLSKGERSELATMAANRL
jgi:PhoH-like ATPase